jgi:hypothetical protein
MAFKRATRADHDVRSVQLSIRHSQTFSIKYLLGITSVRT